MNLDQPGLDFIVSFEGVRLDTYYDEAHVLSLGIGHVCRPSEPWWNDGVERHGVNVITREQAFAMFHDELRMYEACVNSRVTVPIGQCQYTALVDFAYNEGCGALIGSTLLRVLNTGDYATAATHFSEWNKVRDRATGKLVVSDNLVRRRAKEASMFLRDVDATA